MFNFKQKSEDEPQQSAGLSYVRQESGCSQEGEAYSQREPGRVCSATLEAVSSSSRVVPLTWLLSHLRTSAKSITMCLGASHSAWGLHVQPRHVGGPAACAEGRQSLRQLIRHGEHQRLCPGLPTEFRHVARRV